MEGFEGTIPDMRDASCYDCFSKAVAAVKLTKG